MQINIESPHVRLSTELEENLRLQFNRLAKLHNRISGCDVVLRVIKSSDQKNCEVEAHLLIPKSSFFASNKAETFEAAINGTVESLRRQLEHKKDQQKEVW